MFLKNTVCFLCVFLNHLTLFDIFLPSITFSAILISIPTPDRPSFVSNTWGKTWGESAK